MVRVDDAALWDILQTTLRPSVTDARDTAVRLFRSVQALQRALDRYLLFYNVERPRRGYRLRGLTPAIKFRGALTA